MCFMERATLTTAAVEEWRPVVGYEGLYEVSNLGRVRSLDITRIQLSRKGNPFKRRICGHILKAGYNSVTGYLYVNLWNRIGHTYRVHRLVAMAFIPNPYNLSDVNHKDENKLNNRVDNLEWCTKQYNLTYNGLVERRSAPRRKYVEQLTLEGQHIAYYFGVKNIERLTGYRSCNISAACRGEKPQYRGYIWRYVNNPFEEDKTHK